MGIFSRMGDIINSNLNAMLEKAEDPEKIARLIIQEMEDTLVEVRTSAARWIADKKSLTRRLSDYRAAEAEWDQKAELAIDRGREDLARGALTAKQKAAQSAQAVADELERVEEAIAKADADMVKLQAKLNEAKAKHRSLMVRSESADERLKVRERIHDTKIEDVFARYEMAERRVEEREARVEAYDLGGDGETLGTAFSRLQTNEAVEEELAALKRRKRTGSSSRPASPARDYDERDD